MVRLVPLGLLALSLAAAGADQKAAESALKEKGLRRSGSLFVLPAESDFSKKLKAAQALRRELAAGAMRQRAVAQGAADNKRLIVQLTEQRMMLNRQLDAATSVREHNQIARAMNELGDRINLLQEGGVDETAAKEIEKAVAVTREEFMQSVLDARGAAEEAKSKYADLAADAAVKGGLADLSRGRKEKFALGPSRAFRADLKALETLEGSVQTEQIKLRDDDGTYWVDVVFNAKITKPMIFDTGASITNLSMDLATEIGLKITPDLPTVEAHVADGGVVKAKLTKIPSMRVGKFTVENVPVTVMNGSRDDVPPLLGMSFLKHFVYRLDPAKATLTLTQVQAAGARGKAGSKPGAAAGKESASKPVSVSLDEPRILRHDGGVVGAAFLPDGRRVISAASQAALLWDLETGLVTHRFEGHTGNVRALALTADGRRALTGDDQAIRVWDVAEGTKIRDFAEPTPGLRALVVTPDGRQAITGSDDRIIRLWDIETGREIRRFEGHTDTPFTLAVAPDGRRFFSGASVGDPVGRLWDVETARVLCRFEGHTSAIYSAAFAPDGRQVLTGGEDGTIRLWDAETGKEVRRFDGPGGQVHALAFGADGRRALSGNNVNDHLVRLWDVASGRETRRLEGHTDAVKGVAFSPDGRRALSYSYDTTVRITTLPAR